MALRPQLRTLTAAAVAVLAAGGLAACHPGSPHERTAAPVASRGPGGGAPSETPAGGPATSASVSPSASSSPSPTPSASASSGTPSALPRSRHGLPPVISDIPVQDKVVFITIDDGWEKDADFVRLIRDRQIPVTLFLANMAVKKNYGYFRELQQVGALVGDHTMTHPYLPRLSYARQKQEICDAAAIYTTQYGSRPTLFRAPYGATDHDTLRAARDCGMKAIFFWREVVSNGRIAYQRPGGLHRGDILLVHFNPNMTADFKKMLRTIQKQGFRPAAMRDHLPAEFFQ
ncbi:polysaccharide deacetylase family protein [Actinoallomurus purpureus]|uniref:polysaccharide deacetylase family protein n=1 Tax=Actinoallomurus purpureus TaxID=478114 RepID=UPI002093CDD3|nr:polysaccharide deacetylase family protein [Actinoallomurus purpureus]MCO6005805.1 polysaccharide deacetylase family protein [Actinoallomurus purpureus]